MEHRIHRAAALACASLALSACSSVPLNLWPFGGDPAAGTSRTPAGATAYQCDAGKRLFVRYLDSGAAAWVILPEREFRLNKIAAGGATRFSNGVTTLDLADGGAIVSDGAGVTYSGCKSSGEK